MMSDPRHRPPAPLSPEKRLEQAETELRQTLYAVSHDVRAPLRALDGFALALEEDFADRLPAAGLDYLHRIRNAAKKMDRMLEAVVRMSRLSAHTPHVEHACLTHMSHDILSGLKENDPTVRPEIFVGADMQLFTDRGILRVIAQELIANAWKFTAKTERATIRVERLPAPRGMFSFKVEDNGVGFDAVATNDRIFGLFQRFHAPENFPGEGAGLALARRAAQVLGGALTAESRPGHGATFYCTIPDHTRTP